MLQCGVFFVISITIYEIAAIILYMFHISPLSLIRRSQSLGVHYRRADNSEVNTVLRKLKETG